MSIVKVPGGLFSAARSGMLLNVMVEIKDGYLGYCEAGFSGPDLSHNRSSLAITQGSFPFL